MDEYADFYRDPQDTGEQKDKDNVGDRETKHDPDMDLALVVKE